MPAVGDDGEHVATGHAGRGQACAKQDQHGIEGARAVEIADFQLPDPRHKFEVALAVRAATGDHAQRTVDQLLAGLEQFLGREVRAAKRAAGFGADRHDVLRSRRA